MTFFNTVGNKSLSDFIKATKPFRSKEFGSVTQLNFSDHITVDTVGSNGNLKIEERVSFHTDMILSFIFRKGQDPIQVFSDFQQYMITLVGFDTPPNVYVVKDSTQTPITPAFTDQNGNAIENAFHFSTNVQAPFSIVLV